MKEFKFPMNNFYYFSYKLINMVKCNTSDCKNKVSYVLIGVFRFPEFLCNYHLTPYLDNKNVKLIHIDDYKCELI